MCINIYIYTTVFLYEHKLIFPEKQPKSATFHDILPSHCIISADCSAGTYYEQSKFKSVIRRIAEPATDSRPNKESQKQVEELPKLSFRRSILKKPRVQKYVDGLKNIKSSKKGGSFRLFKTSEKRDEENRKEILYDYDSESDEEKELKLA